MARSRKSERVTKRQLGQFMTNPAHAAAIVAALPLTPTSTVLEPSFGTGSFLTALVDRFDVLLAPTIPDPTERISHILTERVWGVEVDPDLHATTLADLAQRYGDLPDNHHLVHDDFFAWALGDPPLGFDLVVGNPPFGGTFDPLLEDAADKRWGRRDGEKIKKETYAFFTVAAAELLHPSGTLAYICSDTFLTIPTMAGLRRFLLAGGQVNIDRIEYFSEETDWPMVLLTWNRGKPAEVVRDGEALSADLVCSTPTASFAITDELAHYFAGPLLGTVLACTSGMTTGDNARFVRAIHTDATGHFLDEPLEFTFVDEPITLERELDRARLRQLSPKRVATIQAAEANHETRRNLHTATRPTPQRVDLPSPDYRPFNVMASGSIVYAPWKKMIFWRDDGDAVLTAKRNGNWYLHGVGGAPFFGRVGLTWNLIADRLEARYLPAGAILDTGAPSGFLRPDVDPVELPFILGWLLTEQANRLVKEVLNHTRNIQSKDIERLCYPWWVTPDQKLLCIHAVRDLVDLAEAGTTFTATSQEVRALDELYAFPTAPLA